MVALKYLSNFWRTLRMPLIDCEVSLMLTWSSTSVITNSTGEGKFKTTDTKLYVPVVFLSMQDNTQRAVHSGYYLPNVEIENYNVMINEENLF